MVGVFLCAFLSPLLDGRSGPADFGCAVFVNRAYLQRLQERVFFQSGLCYRFAIYNWPRALVTFTNCLLRHEVVSCLSFPVLDGVRWRRLQRFSSMSRMFVWSVPLVIARRCRKTGSFMKTTAKVVALSSFASRVRYYLLPPSRSTGEESCVIARMHEDKKAAFSTILCTDNFALDCPSSVQIFSALERSFSGHFTEYDSHITIVVAAPINTKFF